MTDIVERLLIGPKDYSHWPLYGNEAADEIERLRQHLADANYETETVRAATIEECAKPLEQIRQVCADNAGDASNHKMALDFVHQIAIRALKEQQT